MSRVLLGVAALLPACYSPTAYDCRLQCAAASDCVDGQSCTADHFCASPDIATCAGIAVSDGGTVPTDGKVASKPGSEDASSPPPTDARTAPTDAASPPPADAAAPTVQVAVVILGGGSVDASIGTACTHGTCNYTVPVGTSVTLIAVDHGKNVFRTWLGAPCAGQGQTCRFTATTPVLASVVFDHGH